MEEERGRERRRVVIFMVTVLFPSQNVKKKKDLTSKTLDLLAHAPPDSRQLNPYSGFINDDLCLLTSYSHFEDIRCVSLCKARVYRVSAGGHDTEYKMYSEY